MLTCLLTLSTVSERNFFPHLRLFGPPLLALYCSCFLMVSLLSWACFMQKYFHIFKVSHWNPCCWAYVVLACLPSTLDMCILIFMFTGRKPAAQSQTLPWGSYRFWLWPMQQRCTGSYKECRHCGEGKVLTVFLLDRKEYLVWNLFLLKGVTLEK